MKYKRLFFPVICVVTLSSCSLLPTLRNKNENESWFSINLINHETDLKMSTKRGFSSTSESLSLDNQLPLIETTYSELPSIELLDNETTPYDYGKTENGSWRYFKYTFYIKNAGTVSTNYTVNLKIEENDSNGKAICDIARLMVFNNRTDSWSNDTGRVYATESKGYNYDSNGEKTNREFISIRPSNNMENNGHPLANIFDPDNFTMCSNTNCGENYVMRHTLVFWLEGEDPDSTGEPPTGNLKISITIEGKRSKGA